MDFDLLRRSLADPILRLKDCATHTLLPQLCADLGLPPLSDEGSKAQRIAASFNSVLDHELRAVAEKFLELRQPRPALRNELQDILWTNDGYPV